MPRIAIDVRRVEDRRAREDLAERRKILVTMAMAPDLIPSTISDATKLRIGENLDLDTTGRPLLHELRDLVGIERLRRIGAPTWA